MIFLDHSLKYVSGRSLVSVKAPEVKVFIRKIWQSDKLYRLYQLLLQVQFASPRIRKTNEMRSIPPPTWQPNSKALVCS